MKKILVLGLALALFTVGASAQRSEDRFNDRKIEKRFDKKGELTRGEKYKLHRNDVKRKHAERRFKRDGHLSRYEKRKLYKMKRNDRHDTYRYKHNRHHR